MTAADQNVTHQIGGAEDTHAPRWLIGLVVVLGVAFLAMLTVIVVKLINGDGPMSAPAHGPAGQVAQRAPVSDGAGGVSPDRDFAVTRPDGATLIRTELTGREMLMHFRAKDGTDVLVVLNRMTGHESRVVIAP